MKNFQFIIRDDNVKDDSIILTEELAHKVRNVLRYKKGDDIRLLVPAADGRAGRRISGRIEEMTREGIAVRVVSEEPTSESPLFTTFYLSLIKAKNFEVALKKATELGVSRIVPLITERTVVKISGGDYAKKRARWEAIILEAASQCKRDDLPMLTDIMTLFDLRGFIDDADVKVVCDEMSDRPLKEHLSQFDSPKSISAAVGPEGGFTREETRVLKVLGFEPVLLVRSVLRAETVPIFVMSVVQYEFGG